MDLGLSKKVAVVTASSKGLGLAVVKQLLAEGAFVILNGRNKSDLEGAAKKINVPDQLKIYQADVTQKKDCMNLIEFAISKFGKLDILVSNCGGPESGGFEAINQNQWRQAIDRSLISHIYLIEYALTHLKKSPAPTILTITSFTVKSPMSNMVLSNSIRAAAVGLTKSLANEYGPIGIRVNSILPGWTRTNRVDQLLKLRSNLSKSSVENEIKLITDSIPLKRMAEPEEFGKVAAFLVSPSASYVNGVMLNVDGGLNQGLF